MKVKRLLLHFYDLSVCLAVFAVFAAALFVVGVDGTSDHYSSSLGHSRQSRQVYGPADLIVSKMEPLKVTNIPE